MDPTGRRPGWRLGERYRLDERIGAGGMGEVWRATDEVLGRTVAVKVMLPALVAEPGFAQRFLAEARAMASVRHPAVVAIHDYHSAGDTAFLVMEYVQGEALSQTMRRLGRLTPARTMELVAQAADALQAVHDEGIVHRDVKPANLLVRPDGSLVLTDFGIARSPAATGATIASLTATGAVLGTPTYLAPEQILGQPASPQSDVYALGLVAYECLTGRRPFEGENAVAVALRRIREAPRPLDSDVPAHVAAIIERALAADPAHRWPSAAELAAAARHAVSGRAAPAGGPPATAATATVPTVPVPPSPVPAASVPPLPVPAASVPPLPVPAAPVPAAPGPGTGRRHPWWRRRAAVTIAAILVGVALAGAGGVITAMTLPGQAAPDGVGAGAGQQDPSRAPATGPSTAVAGFAPCGELLCPTSPMCWGGLVIISGVAAEPRPLDCEEPHYWETFVAAALPADAVDVRQDELMGRADIARICSEQVLAERSLDPAVTAGWAREPVPFQLDGDAWLMHCLASPELGEHTGSTFRSG